MRMLNVNKNLKYLPRFRFEYTPYGPELVYQNYFMVDSMLIQLNYSHSDSELPKSWRIGGNIWNIQSTKRLSFNIMGQVWNQPKIIYFQDNRHRQSNGLGYLFLTTINFNLLKGKHLFGATINAGYKSSGYVLGEPLINGIILRGGMFFILNSKIN
tara:strand:- start:80 stop:547 length:468 start_codon:yes stop_codon:yes gene_type:complete